MIAPKYGLRPWEVGDRMQVTLDRNILWEETSRLKAGATDADPGPMPDSIVVRITPSHFEALARMASRLDVTHQDVIRGVLDTLLVGAAA